MCQWVNIQAKVSFHGTVLLFLFQTNLKKMKKLVLFGAMLALFVSVTSCGGDATEEKEATTVEFSGNSEAFQLGGFDIVVSVGKYVDNYSDDEIKGFIAQGKKIVKVEIDVLNNSEQDLNLPPAAFTLDKVSTDKKENIGVNNLIALKLDSYEIYDGDVGSTHATGVLYYELDADAKVSDYQLNVRNTMNGDAHVGSLSLKEASRKDAAENTEMKLANASVAIEDMLFDGTGTLTVDKVTDNFQGGEFEATAYEKMVRVDYTITCEKGKVYCSTSDLMMVTDLLKNPIFSLDDELESGSLEAGNSVSGFAIFTVPTGDANYTLVYSDDYELPLK